LQYTSSRTIGEAVGKRQLTSLWNELNHQAKKNLISDLNEMAGGGFTLDNFPSRIPIILSWQPHNLRILREASWNYLPDNIQQQLADYWAGYVTLGISDFHPSNWLIANGSHIVGIDLGMRSTIFSGGSAQISWQLLNSPLGPAPIGSGLQGALRESISPQMRLFLKSLTEAKIRDIANQSKFEIEPNQIQGILARANAL
jgi:hypothetical protein